MEHWLGFSRLLKYYTDISRRFGLQRLELGLVYLPRVACVPIKKDLCLICWYLDFLFYEGLGCSG